MGYPPTRHVYEVLTLLSNSICVNLELKFCIIYIYIHIQLAGPAGGAICWRKTRMMMLGGMGPPSVAMA